eukprot:CAMPEP_0171098286 /NCGR_PEP_ID=MMETSP0766_2-20121228/48035_1 /TAXON_ID=439317 /ORGANISM="Gambierdiscus australes, Strain CAWD 149" /LENGTH=143 /DNA_ID=CAMNT_0011557611 /DNA_START=144 /DNA_END=577 /DNA_ORIENTATION=-
MPDRKPRERGVVTNWVNADYGFAKRDSKGTDVHVHITNAKSERLKRYVHTYGLAPGVRIKFDVDFEENRGRPYAANWEMVDPPKYDVDLAAAAAAAAGNAAGLPATATERGSGGRGQGPGLPATVGEPGALRVYEEAQDPQSQ